MTLPPKDASVITALHAALSRHQISVRRKLAGLLKTHARFERNLRHIEWMISELIGAGPPHRAPPDVFRVDRRALADAVASSLGARHLTVADAVEAIQRSGTRQSTRTIRKLVKDALESDPRFAKTRTGAYRLRALPRR